MNNTELDEYFKHTGLQLMRPSTYINYDDVANPVHSELVKTTWINIKPGHVSKRNIHIKPNDFFDQKTSVGLLNTDHERITFMIWNREEDEDYEQTLNWNMMFSARFFLD